MFTLELKAAKAIKDRADAEGRELTEAECAQVEQLLKAHDAAHNAAKQTQLDRKTAIQAVKDKLDELGLSGPPSGSSGSWSVKTAKALLTAMPSTPDGSKALVSGTITVGNVVDPNVTPIPRDARRLLDLIPTPPPVGNTWNPDPRTTTVIGGPAASGSIDDGVTQDVGNTFSYLRQTVRTNLADVVADNAVKPTSVFTVAEISDRFRVIAHLSEAIPLRYFSDYAKLADFLKTEMRDGVLEKLEQQIVTGTGVGENMTGILTTSGIQLQPWATDLVTTARKALTKLQVVGITPTAWLMHPNDAELFDLLREGAGTGQFLLGGPGEGSDEHLWSIPRVPSTAVTAGTAILADWTTMELVTREDVTLAVDLSGVLFTKNQAQMRVEGRFGLAVKKPLAVVSVDLTA